MIKETQQKEISGRSTKGFMELQLNDEYGNNTSYNFRNPYYPIAD